MSASTKRFRILALDGGQRGVLMTRLLQRLQERLPGFLDKVDLFAGTSAGAITSALILTSGSLKLGLERAYRFWFEARFAQANPLHTVLALSGHFPLMSNAPMLKQLRLHLGDTTLGQLKHRVIFPTFQLDNGASDPVYRNWTPRLFHNLPVEGASADELLSDVVMRSGSAPIVSPAYQGYADGALYANNPSLCALSLAKDFTGLPIEQIEIFSVGMGQNPIYFNKHTDNLGYMDWFLDSEHPMAMLNAVSESNLKAISYQCGRLLESGFYRLDPRLPHAFLRTKHQDEAKIRSDLAAWKDVADNVNLSSAETWLVNHGWCAAPKSKPKTTAKPVAKPVVASKKKSAPKKKAAVRAVKPVRLVKAKAKTAPVSSPESIPVSATSESSAPITVAQPTQEG